MTISRTTSAAAVQVGSRHQQRATRTPADSYRTRIHKGSVTTCAVLAAAAVSAATAAEAMWRLRRAAASPRQAAPGPRNTTVLHGCF